MPEQPEPSSTDYRNSDSWVKQADLERRLRALRELMEARLDAAEKECGKFAESADQLWVEFRDHRAEFSRLRQDAQREHGEFMKRADYEMHHEALRNLLYSFKDEMHSSDNKKLDKIEGVRAELHNMTEVKLAGIGKEITWLREHVSGARAREKVYIALVGSVMAAAVAVVEVVLHLVTK
jgi:hypothetical protein